ncbi:MAG: hypothetical protein H7210_12810 [Pyrinomonadaceae bacterium]|nr:hypothetical protein [Phycisphaerales bacterium]
MKAPADGWAAPTALDIENYHGTVTIIVDPDVTELKTVAKVHASLWIDDVVRSQAQDSVRIRTRTLEQEGRTVCSIRTSTRWGDPRQVWVDLTLTMPRCDGVRIFNRGGSVTLVGVSGALQVDNGEFADSSGPIEVRTNAVIVDPVVLVTSSGNIFYQVGPGSTGAYTLDATDGSESFDSTVARPEAVHSNGSVTTATVGDAENSVVLRSAKGDVSVIYMNDAQAYINRFR